MDFNLTEEQEMLYTSARDFLVKECPPKLIREMEQDEKGYSPELWRKMAGLGWMGLPVPEAYGGMGGSFLDLVLLLEETGRARLIGPFFSTVVLGGLTIVAAGSEAQKKALLPEIAEGKLQLTLALYEADGQLGAASVKTKAETAGTGWRLSGTKLFVTDAHTSKYIITPALTGKGISLFLVDAEDAGVNRTLLRTLGGDKQCEVSFNGAVAAREQMLGEAGKGWDYIEKVLPRITIAKCAEMVGGAQQVLDMTVNYAKERKQFGHPIGSFQAVQHHCANMAADVDTSKYATYRAAWMLNEGLPCVKEVSAAKAWVGQACHRVTMLGAQVHGSIGLTIDHDFPLYYRQAKTGELLFGDSNFHREIVAREAGL
ncbi:MAG: acyl-CoA dehydrogenase family protein [Chloroflexota bacterium]